MSHKKRNISITILLAMACGWAYLHYTHTNLTPYEQYAQEKIIRKRGGEVKTDAPEMLSIISRELRTKLGDTQPRYAPNQLMEEFLKAKNRAAAKRSSREQNTLTFVERGPGNVAGRTRAFLIDPDDASGSTWYAGSASGGIWKTTDKGTSWSFISSDIPNLGTNTLAMSPANTQIIYAGTGEHFTNDIDGAGLFKSADKGATWTQVASPATFNDFKNVSRIIVDPNNANVVLATTRNSLWEGRLEAAIYKSTDGGVTWSRKRSSTSQRYDDMDFDPTNFNTIYVAVNGTGVIKSTDAGETWADASTGMTPSGRVEITVSPVNTSRIWASVQGGLSGNGSDLYVSNDGAATWELTSNADGSANEDFLGGQGWYDNIVTAHPFDENTVYVGGVNVFKFTLTNSLVPLIKLDVTENGTEPFLSFINFGGDLLGGGISTEKPLADLSSIEIRFGEGSQFAHRFTVAGQGSGVPDADYLYQNYVEVPFQVWNTETNQQLMVAFRDQQEDGSWDLIPANTDGDPTTHSREYLFVYSTPYSTTPDPLIGQNGGVANEREYFIWPVLTAGATFDATNLPVSNLSVLKAQEDVSGKTTTVVSDAYGQFTGTNSFPQSSRDQGLHPDQHNIVIGDTNSTAGTFRLYITNDGGVYESVAGTDPGPTNGDFIYASDGYNTTQFYGADKAPGEYRFIGGMQDNGTWYNPASTEGTATATARFGIGGDGFESLWHSTNINKMIGGFQFSGFVKTTDGGVSWQSAQSGYDDQGPFITRLTHHKILPERLFTVGASGVWRSLNFGTSWSASTMNNPGLWRFSNSTDVEVSLANQDIIWAGTHLSSDGVPHVSIDGGLTFNAVSNDGFQMGSASGLATHPANENTAYLLFSFADFPKVLKTEDLGQTWTDISGFDGTGESTRGFPNVAVNCLFVFPADTNRLWVGSEIGIIESLDGGTNWGLLDGGMPYVNVYDFKLSDSTVTIATYGRGIWSVDIDIDTTTVDTTDIDIPEEPVLSAVEAQKMYIYPTVVAQGEMVNLVGLDNATKKLQILDSQGREIAVIQHLGDDSAKWNTEGVNPGIYLLRDENSLIGKVIVK